MFLVLCLATLAEGRRSEGPAIFFQSGFLLGNTIREPEPSANNTDIMKIVESDKSDMMEPIAKNTDITKVVEADKSDMMDENAGDFEAMTPEERRYWVHNFIRGRHHHWIESAQGKWDFNSLFKDQNPSDWALFGLVFLGLVPLFSFESPKKTSLKSHISMLILWVAVAYVYNMLVYSFQGEQRGTAWFGGYLMELIFSLENIFVFQLICDTFSAPREQALKAFCIVVCCQIAYEMMFFLMFSRFLQKLRFLPYILGVWLLYVSYACTNSILTDEEEEKTDSSAEKVMTFIFRDRYSAEYDPDLKIFVVRNEKVCITKLALLVVTLVLIDFALEIDVILTKIHQIENRYTSFTSSATAAFMVPALYFVACVLLKKFVFLKYGICFVVGFFGLQMLLHELFTVPALINCGIMIVIMAISVSIRFSNPFHQPYSVNKAGSDDVN